MYETIPNTIVTVAKKLFALVGTSVGGGKKRQRHELRVKFQNTYPGLHWLPVNLRKCVSESYRQSKSSTDHLERDVIG